MAAAIGAGLPVHEPMGNLIIDVGGGTSEVAMVSMGGLITMRSLRIGGFDMDEVVQRLLRRNYGIAIGERAAERVKIAGGSAYPVEGVASAQIQGREITTGMPKMVEVSPEEIREAMAEPIRSIVQAVRDALECVPPELCSDIYDRGVVLTGGGALLRNLDRRLREETGLPVLVAENPLTSVVLGAGRMLTDLALLKKVTADD